MKKKHPNRTLWWVFTLALVLILMVAWWMARPELGRREQQIAKVSKITSGFAEETGPSARQTRELDGEGRTTMSSVSKVAVLPEPLPAPKPAAPSEPVQLAEPRPKPLPSEILEPAREQAEALALNIRQYRLRFGGNPVGSNAEIVRELDGANPAQARYLPAELKRLNERGELLDAWGTPYFFHQESADRMEVRSAGADRILWTSDDVVSY